MPVITDNFKKVVKYLESKGAKKLFHGCDRAAMCRGQFVYKIPRNASGVGANFKEEYIFRNVCKKKEALVKDGASVQLLGFARCRMIYLYDIPVIVMEKVIPLIDSDSRRTDFINRFDGGQCGEGRKGDFLFYDYSLFVNKLNCYDKAQAKISAYMDANKSDIGWGDLDGFNGCYGSVKDKESLERIINGG